MLSIDVSIHEQIDHYLPRGPAGAGKKITASYAWYWLPGNDGTTSEQHPLDGRIITSLKKEEIYDGLPLESTPIEEMIFWRLGEMAICFKIASV